MRFGSFNLSFDRGTYEELKEQMLMEQPDQDVLIEKYRDGSASEAEIEQAKAILQIRNVAEIIQRTNPDVFVLAEFNNDGIGTDMDALNGFQTNYLSQQQKEEVETVTYGHKKNVSTNTGKDSTFDLNNDGKTGEADDAWGFGGYHGQYAFAVFSKYPFDDTKYRTFQNFKWRDMPGEFNPLIEKCDDTNKIPDDKVCGDAWYSKEAWELFPVSSKNHIDLPVSIPETKNSDTPVHFLVSHPTPPIFDSVALRNYKRNRAEVQFWSEYIEGRGYFVDDGGADRGLEEGAHFVIAGDLNADPEVGDGDRPTIEALLKHTLVNTEATIGANKPTSSGAQAFLGSSACSRNCDRSNGSVVTQTSGMRLDYVIPSASLSVLRSGVFWPAPGEPGYNLVYDKDLGVGKEVSSDHRMVWMDLYPTNN
ncbi:succinyl-CoA synthetase subunit alpha [Endozoicomonas sp. (ex Bugula neritina AB1)]|nr:succinyl-CoA synthetase subunit alpha [Endozoicomonas sp. (ex Bugula neritina AB1)]